MDILNLVDHHDSTTTRGHNYPNILVGGSASAHLGDVHVHANLAGVDELQESRARQELLTALAYDGMNTRRRQLAQNSAQYLDWIWQSRYQGGSGFAEWLSNRDETMFWITGKPGSGKSTLMQYLSDHENVLDRLRRGARRKWLVVHFHFDYRAGSHMPNSLLGLLRTILFQIAGQSTVAERAIRKDKTGRDVNILHNELNQNELCRLLRVATRAISKSQGVCGFIDGLDEFSGRHADVVTMVQLMVENGVNKMCVASRPEHGLVQRLSGKPHLRMQDHNSTTIQAYVNHSLREIAYSHSCLDLDDLVGCVVKQAEGVILWAQLVTNFLTDGILADETEDEIRDRLNEFPKELNDAYSRLLKNVDPMREVESAILLCLIQTASSETSPWHLHCAMVFLRDLGQLPSWPKETLTATTFLRRLRARTGSMVDVIQGPSIFPDLDLYGLNSDDPIKAQFHSRAMRVRLFHKTLDGYISASKWVQHVLSIAQPPIDQNQLWVQLCTRSLLENDLSARGYLQVLEHLTSSLETYSTQTNLTVDTRFENDKTFKVATALKNPYVVDSGLAFLDCALELLPSHLVWSGIKEGSQFEQLEAAVGSRINLLHFIRNRLRNFHAPNSMCLCYTLQMEGDCSSIHEHFILLSTRHRAALFTLVHRVFDQFDPETLEQDMEDVKLYSKACMKILGLLSLSDARRGLGYLTPSDIRSLRAVARELGAHVDDSDLVIFVEWGFSPLRTLLMHEISRSFVSRPDRQLLHDDLRSASGSYTLDLEKVRSAGYNLLFLWVWNTQLSASSTVNELPEDKNSMLSALIVMGLDINQSCSVFGPPLHTAIETIMSFTPWSFRALQKDDFIIEHIIRCLLRHGAEIDVLGPHGSALQTAKRKVRMHQAGQYDPFLYNGPTIGIATVAALAVQKMLEEAQGEIL